MPGYSAGSILSLTSFKGTIRHKVNLNKLCFKGVRYPDKVRLVQLLRKIGFVTSFFKPQTTTYCQRRDHLVGDLYMDM